MMQVQDLVPYFKKCAQSFPIVESSLRIRDAIFFFVFFIRLYNNLNIIHLFLSQRLVCAHCRKKISKLNISRKLLYKFDCFSIIYFFENIPIEKSLGNPQGIWFFGKLV